MFSKFCNIWKPILNKLKCRKGVVLYFVPHQDDEILTLGIDICYTVRHRKDVHVILCTDGSMDGTRQTLNDHKECLMHREKHNFDLSVADFIKARDDEFVDSCLALGVQRTHIHILPNRAVDGSLTMEYAKELIEQCLEKYGKDATVCTMHFNSGKYQHKDHRALGQAARRLFLDRKIKKVRFCKELYLNLDPDDHTVFHCKIAGADIQSSLQKSIQAYALWNPDIGRYAVGSHSVGRHFNTLQRLMRCYYIKVK